MDKKAFTLVELMVVIAIIAILAVGGITGYNTYITKARISKYLNQEIQAGKNQYSKCIDAGTYKNCGPGLLIVSERYTGNLYRISTDNTGEPELFTNVSSINPTISPDGEYVLYSNGGDGNKIYKKDINSGPNDLGEVFINSSGTDSIVTLDNKYVIFVHNNSIVYKKDINSGPDDLGEVFINQRGEEFYLTPDGESILFRSSSGGNLYLKSLKDSNSTNLGKQITDINSGTASITPDGKYIIYSNGSDTWRLWKKDITSGADNDGSRLTNAYGVSTGTSLDGESLYYIRLTGSWRLYKKELSDSSTGAGTQLYTTEFNFSNGLAIFN